MSTRWDPLLAAATARELDSVLRGERVRSLMLDRERRRLTLFLREHSVVFELHPLHGWLLLLPGREPPAAARPFARVVRGVSAPLDESILVFELRPYRGRSEAVEIVVELIGNRWNACVVAAESRAIRHVLLPRADRIRTLDVGVPYQPPTPTDRAGRDARLDEAGWREAAGAEGGDPASRRAAILRRIAWTSSINVDALVGPEGWRRWTRMIEPANWGAFLVPTPRGPQPYPVALEANLASPPSGRAADSAIDSTTEPCRPFPTLVEAFLAARELDPSVEPISSIFLPPGLLADVEGRVADAESKIRALERELAGLESPESVRVVGDLILARFAEIPRGRSRATLTGFDGRAVEVELDASLGPEENAARCYREAARRERALDSLPDLIHDAKRDARKWSRLLEGIRSGTIEPDEIPPSTTSRPIPIASGRLGTREARPVPYRRFMSSSGLEIRVGKGARHNDDLTFHHSSPADIWLHVQQAPGAHVILRWQGDGTPPRQDLAEAANLAALHSPARGSASVPVAWTRRKYVRKPRGASPGIVIPERVQTVFVAPESELIDRLAAD